MRKVLVGAIAAACALATACGSSSGGSANAGGNSPSEKASTGAGDTQSAAANSSEPPKSLTDVTIALPVFNITDAPLLIADAKGYFEDNGIKVKHETVSGSSSALAALTAGTFHFATVATPAFVIGKSKKLDLLSVASMLDGAAEQLVVSNAYLKDHPIPDDASLADKMKALRGAKFGQVGLTDESFIAYLLAQAGLPSDALHPVKISGSSALLTSLQRGLIDAYVQSPPLTYQAEEENIGKIVVDSPPAWKNIEYFVVVTTPGYAKSNPDIVKAVASAIGKADAFITSNPDDAVKLLQPSFPDLSAKVLSESVRAVPWSPDGKQSQESWDAAVKLEKDTGLIDVSLPVEEGTGWTNDYIS